MSDAEPARDWRRRLIIGLSIALAAVVALNIAARLAPEDAVEVFDGGGDVLSVTELLASPEGELRIVRGFVFEDAIGLRLCQGRERDPVVCVGPFVDLVGFDLGSVPTGSTGDDGDEVFYSDGAVTVVGTLSLTTFTVEDIVAGG